MKDYDAIDHSTGWYPHAVGDYWINRNFTPCDSASPWWYWKVVKTIDADTAVLFQKEMHYSPCDTSEYKIKKKWYAYTNDHKVLTLTDKYEFECVMLDFSKELGESFDGNCGIRYTVVEKNINKLVLEYDEYLAGTIRMNFVNGIGETWNFNEARIGGKTYVRGEHY